MARVMFVPRLLLIILLSVMAACGGLVYHRVDQGDTLYAVSWRYGQDFRDLVEWNKLKPPYTLLPGEWLRVAPPVEGIPVRGRSSPSRDVSASALPPVYSVESAPSASSHTRTAPVESGVTPAAPVRAQPVIAWSWPTTGPVLQAFTGAKSGNKGVDIGGRIGQPVRAAAPGRVVYAGNGLLNYGNLIIIKHDDDLLSAYGYNQLLRVAENQVVAAGQHIADMGMKMEERPMLHFEIRYDGKPVDPLTYLGPMPANR